MQEIVGQKMSEYTSVDTLAQAKKDAFLASASVTVFGTDPDDANSTVNYNVPLSEITPSPTASSLAGDGLEVSDGKLAVINKVPAPGTETNRGKVLTVNSSDEVVWEAPGGGGGGGNPYTKVSVTPGESYANGKKSDYGWNLYDQDVNISNNTYSVVSTEIGYDSSKEYPDSRSIDVFKIKMPANIDFPMAVVEFQLKTGENASVNKVEVYVGETKLTQVKDAPYRDDAIVGKSIDYDNEIVHHTEYGNNYWTLGGIWNNNLASAYTGIVNSSFDHIYVKVQVHIFGSCYRVMTSHQGSIPPAS